MRSLLSYCQKTLIVLLGAPGVGKALQMSFPHITTGDIIRKEIKEETDLGALFQSYVETGVLIPDDLIVDLMWGRVSEVLECGNSFFLDGFPRTLGQAEILESLGVQIGGAGSQLHCIHLTQDFEIIVEKMINRRMCSVCQTNYNFAHIVFKGGVYEMPPLVPEVDGICDICGEEDSLIQRDDDKEEVVRNRLQIYQEDTFPLVEFFESRGVISEFEVVGGTKELMSSFLELVERVIQL